MKRNIANGGLILQTRYSRIMTDLAGCTGTYYVEPNGTLTKIDKGLFWFMNTDDNYVYYSDQLRQNYLYRFNLAANTAELLRKTPCYGLTLHAEYLYFIDEQDQCLYRCRTDGTVLEKLVNERVTSFVLAAPLLWYAVQNGPIKTWHLQEDRQNSVLDKVASRLIVHGESLIFPHSGQKNQLNIFNLRNENLFSVDGIQATSIIAHGQFLYCINKLDNSSIYRIALQDGSSIRICSSWADYLHILDDELYFICEKVKGWYRLSLLGGQAVPVILD